MEQNVIFTVTGLENARQYCLWANRYPLRVHVAIDTGMGRFGVHWTDLAQMKEIYALPGLLFEGIFSHFSKSFEKRYCRTGLQLERFLSVTGWMESQGYPVGLRHIANSCAALRFPETRLDAVRIGSALVGRLGVPVPVKLEEAAVLKAQVMDRKTLLPGDTTGYASAFKVCKKTDVIVAAIGSCNGFGCRKVPERLHAPDLAGYLWRTVRYCRKNQYVMFSGSRLKLVGRIGNQYTLFDASGVDIRPGDYVTARANMLFPGQEVIFVEETAELSQI